MYGSDDDGTDPRGEDVILTETDDEDVSQIHPRYYSSYNYFQNGTYIIWSLPN